MSRISMREFKREREVVQISVETDERVAKLEQEVQELKKTIEQLTQESV